MDSTCSITYCVLFIYLVFLNITNGDLIEDTLHESNYSSKVYNVFTRDGWDLKFHRIFKSSERFVTSKKGVVLLIHGLGTSGIYWVVWDRKTRLTFNLIDAGYDVWLFNARGTSYTRHQIFAEGSKEYWNYSWHEIGEIDIPAVIDKILFVTGERQLSCVGYSQGGATFLVTLATRPSYNAKISSAHLMAPGVYPNGMTAELNTYIDYIEGALAVLGFMGIYGVTQQEPLFKIAYDLGPYLNNMVENVRDMIFNWESDGLELKDPKVITTRDGTSGKQYAHYAQNVIADRFQQFDYGAIENLKRYGMKEPPAYNLSRVKVPVSIFYGTRDPWLPVKGIKRLVSELPNVVKVVELPFGHSSFASGAVAVEKVYKPIIQMLDARATKYLTTI